jgi:hypothetical protein
MWAFFATGMEATACTQALNFIQEKVGVGLPSTFGVQAEATEGQEYSAEWTPPGVGQWRLRALVVYRTEDEDDEGDPTFPFVLGPESSEILVSVGHHGLVAEAPSDEARAGVADGDLLGDAPSSGPFRAGVEDGALEAPVAKDYFRATDRGEA